MNDNNKLSVKFSSETLNKDLEMNPNALSTLVPTKSLFSLPIDDILNKTFSIVERLLDRNDDVNDVVVNNPTDDADLRNRVRFIMKSSVNAPRVALSVRQILNLKTKDAKHGVRKVSDLIYAQELTGLPLKFRFSSVTNRTEKLDDVDVDMYPYHLYQLFVEKQDKLKEIHTLQSPELDFDFGAIYKDYKFLSTLRGSELVDYATSADILKDVVIKISKS